MKLVQREIDKLLIFTAARMAERRKADGVKLNYPESIAIIADFVQERARRGDTVANLKKKADGY
jgi:urease gamma subunit